MTEHVTGRQARELLDGATPGPWRWEDRDYPEHEEGYEVLWNGAETALRSQDSDQYSSWVRGSDNDKALAAAAPALAATVAWLYGQTGQDYDGDWQLDHHDPYYQFAAVRPDGEGRISLAVGPYGQEILLDPDEAVEVARALLTAAEDARRHTD